MDEPWKHFAKLKKPITKGHILYKSMQFSGCLGLQDKEGGLSQDY